MGFPRGGGHDHNKDIGSKKEKAGDGPAFKTMP